MAKKMLAVLCMAFIFILAGCGTDPQIPQTLPPETTVPVTVPANGDPADVTCRGSYTASGPELSAAWDTAVASVGDARLTNGQLQVYYWLEAAAYRRSAQDIQPDFSQPLDTQVCQIDNSVGSWQQYFLREALTAWHTRQALVLQSLQEPLATEEALQPDDALYAKYLPEEAPAMQYHSGSSPLYQPNAVHQAWLDSIPEMLDSLAAQHGYADSDALAAAIAGAGAEELSACTELANRAYLYFTELSYDICPSASEIEAYYDAHPSDYAAAGISGNPEKTVDIRHILLIPEGAGIAADGTVSADEAAWTACHAQAEALVAQWQAAVGKTRYASQTPVDPAESRFSELARIHSADPGSSSNGGLYEDLHPGLLTQVLEEWCFDASRQHGDYEILRSSCGIHIVFFSDSEALRYAAAEADLQQELYFQCIRTAMERYPLQADHSAMVLGQAVDCTSSVTLKDLLYPDVAHERFPSVPLYIQQDYPNTRYGYYELSSHGCGPSVLAMAATYLTDQEITPAEIAATYGYYCGKHGSELFLIDDTPAELGFQMVKRSHDWKEIDVALENGQLVASLQHRGYWTNSGHYILIIGKTEDGRYIVRDSHLPNYARISGHQIDSHSQGSLTAAGQYFWIFGKKTLTTPACVRCAPEGAAMPEALFRADYLCQRCLTAIARRDAFLSSPAG